MGVGTVDLEVKRVYARESNANHHPVRSEIYKTTIMLVKISVMIKI